MDENTHNYYENDNSLPLQRIEGSSLHQEPDYVVYDQPVNVRPRDFSSMKTNPAYAENISNYTKTRSDHLETWRQRKNSIVDRQAKTTTTVVLVVVCVVTVVALFSLLLSLAALSVTIVEVGALREELSSDSRDSAGTQTDLTTKSPSDNTCLTQELENLRAELNESQEEIGNLRIHASTNEADISRLLVELDSLKTQLNVTQHQLEQEQAMLQTSIGALTNSSIDPFQNCYQEVENCFASPMDGRYWRQCNTAQLPIDRPGQFTTNMHCEYTSERFPGLLQESAYLRPDNRGSIQCVCEVTYPREDAPGHFVIPNDVAFLCVLVITRCPHSQT